MSGSRAARRAWAGAAVVATLAIVFHAQHSARAHDPGHGDYSYYFSLAKSISRGDGFRLNYVWHFLNLPSSAQNLPNDYWMPGSSIVMAGFMAALGRSLRVALLPGLLAWLGFAGASAAIAWRFSRHRAVALGAAATTLVIPEVARYSLVSDGAIYYACFATAALALLLHARGRPLWYGMSGLCVGLAHLSRQDGLLLLLPLALACFLLVEPARRLRCLTSAGAAYLVIMAPLLVANVRIFGAPLPPAPRRTAFLLEYEDLYSYGKSLSLGEYLRHPLGDLVALRWTWLSHTADAMSKAVGGPLPLFLLLAGAVVVAARMPSGRLRLVVAAFPVALSVFHVVAIPVISRAGGYVNSALPILSLLGVCFCLAFHRIWATSRAGARAVATVAAGALTVIMATSAHRAVTEQISNDNARAAALRYTTAVLPPGAVVMTRDPWELTEATGRRSVQIPNAESGTIVEVACRENVTHLIWTHTRPALVAMRRSETLRPVAGRSALYELEPPSCPRRSQTR